MRKALIIITLLTYAGVFAQMEIGKKVSALVDHNVTFKPYSVLTTAPANRDPKIAEVVEKATFATIRSNEVAQLAINKDAYVEISIPYDGHSVDVQLYKVDIFAEGFHVDTDMARAVPYQQGVYYRGIVKGDTSSVAAFSFFNNELTGLVSSATLNNLVIAKLDKPGNTTDYIIYSDGNMKIQNDFECHASDDIKESEENRNHTANPESAKCVTMFFEIDYSLYTTNGANITTTTNWMTSAFNNVQTLYNNDGISVALKSIFIWTTPDPYTGDSSSEYLEQFNDLRPIFDGDVGQLVGIDSGGLGGVAKTIDGLCSDENYSYSDLNFSFNTVPFYSWTIMVITHEFGHLLGSPHTHACIWNGNNTPIDSCGPYSIGSSGEGFSCMTTPPLLPSSSAKGSIMSYCHLVGGIGISLANGFGAQPKARVLAAVNGSTCLSTDCINTCINSVVDINTVINGTTATITWIQLGTVTNWLISATPSTSAPVWIQVTGNNYVINDLQPNTYYKIIVRPDCDAAMTTETVQQVFLTAGDYCSGLVLTDSGGPTGSYSNNENFVRTIIPTIVDKKIKLTFTSFFLIGQDKLSIFNGNSTAAADLTNGGLSGNTIPGPFESTAADGSLTLQFISDGTLVRPGFAANVSCTSLLGIDNFESNIDFTYAPNPADGWVSITSRTAITGISVYNNLGQLLYHANTNANDAKVDMTAFAKGTYFFKLKFNGREANFKILKK
jgi:metallopeptidase family M12-like protein/type IX secretion system substrate protein